MAKTPIAKNWSNIITVDGIKYSNPDNIPDIIPPSVPGTPSVASNGTSSLSLSWTASTDTHGIKHYSVYRSTSSGGTYTLIGTTIINAFVDTGLLSQTPYFYKIKATDDSLNQNESAFSGMGAATTDAPPVSSGPWQLAAGHYVTEVLPAVVLHPRPDSDITTYDRHRWAYYDMVNQVQYRIPIGIQGGAAPFYFTLISGPPGMAVGRQYGDEDYSIVTWTPSAAVTDYPVSIMANTQDGKIIMIDYTISTSSSTERFLFVDANAADNLGTGSINDPFKNTRGWFKDSETNTEHSGKIVYYRGGTHYWFLQPTTNSVADGNGTFDNLNKPMVHLGYPGETVNMDMRYCKISLSNGARGIFFGGMNVINAKKQKTTGMLRFEASCNDYNGGGMRVTRFELTIEGFPPTYIKEFEDMTGTNSRGDVYSWVNVAGTNDYYATSNHSSGKAFDGFGGGDSPAVLYADYNGARTLLSKQTPAEVTNNIPLVAGKWKWVNKGTTPLPNYTIQVYLPDGTNPASKGTGWLVATSWSGTIGTNSGTIWSDESSKRSLINGQRRYFLDSYVNFSWLNITDKDNGTVYHGGDNGPIACFMLNLEYGLQEFCNYTNCTGGRTIAIGKSSCRYTTRRFIDASSSTNDFYTRAISHSNVCEHDLARTSHSHELCWSKIRMKNPSNAGYTVIGWVKQGTVLPLGTDGLIASYRNTLIHSGNRGVYQGDPDYFTNMFIKDDLCLTNDSDGWILSVSQPLPAAFRNPTQFKLANTAVQATDLNSTFDVLSGSAFYGVAGATVA